MSNFQSPFTFVVPVFQGGDVCGIHEKHGLILSALVVTFKLCNCPTVTVPLPLQSPFSKGLMCVVNMETRPSGYNHNISEIRMEPLDHVSMYTTNITPLENGDCKGKGTVTVWQLQSLSVTTKADRIRPCFSGTPNTSPPGKREQQRERDSES